MAVAQKYWNAALLVVGALVFVWALTLFPMPTNTTPLPTVTLTAGDATIVAEVASTPDEQQKGLSDRLALADGTGMLFVYDKEGSPGIWMKDMNFPIDIVWANSEGIIVTIESDVSPATYPSAFYPSAPAAYVLEIPAGYAKKHDIAIGGQIVVK